MGVRIRVDRESDHQDTLCATCENGTVARTTNGKVFVKCSYFKDALPAPIESCSSYVREEPDKTKKLNVMWAIAHVLDPKALAKGKAGFVPPSDQRPKLHYDDVEDLKLMPIVEKQHDDKD